MRTRQQDIIRTGYTGIITNLLVVISKGIVGFTSGSLAILMDAINNLADALSSIITIVGVKLAGRPATDKHPFGYGRIEYFAAIIVSTMIIITGGSSLIESIKGIINPEPLEFNLIGLIIIAVTIVVKFFLGIYTKSKGKQLKSDALISSGTDSLSDCVVSSATLIGAIIFYVTGWNIDCWLAAVISCLIIKSGVEVLLSPVSDLLGSRSSHELIAAIKLKAKEVKGVRGAYDVVLHNYGPEHNMGSLHVEVDESLSAADLHHITHEIQALLYTEFGIFFTVGFYAHHSGGDIAETEGRIREYVLKQDGVLGMHGFFLDQDKKILLFDIVYSFRLQQPVSLRQQIYEWLQNDYSDYTIIINLDKNYSE